jgi:YidC/Oxa1 family membrane protein insertase
MDRNQIIGLLLIAGLLLVYIEFLAPKTAKKVNTEKETAASSPTRTQPDSLVTQKQKTTLGVFAPTAAEDNQTEVSLENEDVKILFSRKGGLIKSVLLKKYKTYAQQPLYILGKENKFNEWILTKEGKINLADLYFHTYAAKETVGKNEKKATRGIT